MSYDKRVEFARKLLRDVDRDRIKNMKDETAKRLCQCGHIRSEHGASYSINYTGGVCKVCDCMNYMENREKFVVGATRIMDFPGREVERHLKLYGHLPELGCCIHDQPSHADQQKGR